MHFDPMHVILALLGLVLHFLLRYGEHWRKVEKVGPTAYVALDPIGWAVAVIGAAATFILLPDVGPAIGLSASPAGVFVAGYMGSSLAVKIPNLLTGRKE
jgi:nucleoside recognition membrane protein YjiH